MDGACLRFTQMPGTSRLFADYLYDFGKVSNFYRHAPGKAASFDASLASIDYPDSRRAVLVAALQKINPGSSNLKKLAQPGTVAVVTGQQVGLFTGPAYTVFKAVTAAAVARQLTENGTPAVPVFWLATEDHDFPEVAVGHVFDASANVATLCVTTSGAPDRPVGTIAPDGGFPLDQLEQALQGFPFAAEVMTLVREAHAEDQTMGGAFRETLRRLLSSLDLVFIDPLDPEVRAIGAPFLADAIAQGDTLYPRLLERNKQLSDAGYHAQVHVEADTSLFFLLEKGRRIALKRAGGEYVAKDRRFTPQQLAAKSDSISPNALLRPVLQDFLLPTVAYVGGPAELAYFAQSEVLYSALLGRMPVMLPRNSFTLIDSRAQKLLTRYGLQLTDVLVRYSELSERIAAKLVPAAIHTEFQQAGEQTQQILDHLERSLLDFDPSLAKALSRSKAKMLFQLSKMEKKSEREALRRDERSRAEAQHLANMLYPEGHFQERFFSILPFVAQYGTGIIDQIVQYSCIDCVDHHVLPV
jgi:bacillithiol biosynthesis cysteine-adding enzyme BshC